MTTIAVKERAIHYTRAMRDARRRGEKTQTRRVIKPQPETRPDIFPTEEGCRHVIVIQESLCVTRHLGSKNFAEEFCPYGRPGDVLYVHEPITFLSVLSLDEKPRSGTIRYDDDGTERVVEIPKRIKPPSVGRWPGRTLPPEWARDRDRILEVRVERVQEISGEDARDEGIASWRDGLSEKHAAQLFAMASVRYKQVGAGDPRSKDDTRRGLFCHLWESINEKRGFGWAANPLVWVVLFEGLKP